MMMEASWVTMRQRMCICAEVLPLDPPAPPPLLVLFPAVDEALADVCGAAVTAGLEALELATADAVVATASLSPSALRRWPDVRSEEAAGMLVSGLMGALESTMETSFIAGPELNSETNCAESSAMGNTPVLALLCCFSGVSSEGERDRFLAALSEDMMYYVKIAGKVIKSWCIEVEKSLAKKEHNGNEFGDGEERLGEFR
jgi:hypothetical protein